MSNICRDDLTCVHEMILTNLHDKDNRDSHPREPNALRRLQTIYLLFFNFKYENDSGRNIRICTFREIYEFRYDSKPAKHQPIGPRLRLNYKYILYLFGQTRWPLAVSRV